ncbi:hypothetical protein P4H65_06225 [Paenibacillus chitinolyticus]|uniref:hypothetical protein n=1 Tax=Paenibacillus chitinolyticus TaxID=79263 RepID=UPI002DBC3F1D|nr:hypothetical protein [Paenibacillus chitinolyticus]MEC0245393.1 hypothetical protein [Paenibacillus chitinolyticus]
MKDADWERLLRQSLASAAEPEEKLNQRIIDQLKEHTQMKRKYKKRVSAGLLAAVLLLVLSVSAYAATRLYSAKQVAEHLGDPQLAVAFESKGAIQVNQSIASGDYRFTLHGLVSGAGLTKFKHSSEEIFPDRTYAVVSIARQDGKPMPNIDDPEYGKVPFFISPLIKGQKPWQVNIASMNGAYSEDVIDGVMYRLIECSQVEMFADRGVYLAISSGSTFFSREAFAYDEKTGELKPKEDYSGATALFDLPLDVAKANPAKAEAYLKALLNPSSSQANDAEEEEWVKWSKDLRAKIRDGQSIGETIPESVKEVTYDDSGNIKYTHEDWSVTTSPKEFFEEGQIGFSDRISISGDGNTYKTILFHRDENGVITGRIVILDYEPKRF